MIHQGSTLDPNFGGMSEYNMRTVGSESYEVPEGAPAAKKHWLPEGWLTLQNPSGYNDQSCFMKWCVHFVKSVPRRNTSVYIFLCMDGHDSHFNSKALAYLKTYNVFVFFLRSNNSALDQPNDNGSNAALKALYMKFYEEYFSGMPGSSGYLRGWGMKAPQFNYIFMCAWQEFRCTKGQVIFDSFRKTGIQPPSRTCPNNTSAACNLGSTFNGVADESLVCDPTDADATEQLATLPAIEFIRVACAATTDKSLLMRGLVLR